MRTIPFNKGIVYNAIYVICDKKKKATEYIKTKVVEEI
jgi:hypothetical protein